MDQIVAFIASGSAAQLSRAIEECVRQNRPLHALVVPWESDGPTVSMAVTSMRADGWAIEHTNVGTIKLTDLGGDRTRVEVIAHPSDHPDRTRLSELLSGFGRQVQSRLQVRSDS